jgi:protein-L-isoaspartate(D-aspartate) O-methyltransferase
VRGGASIVVAVVLAGACRRSERSERSETPVLAAQVPQAAPADVYAERRAALVETLRDEGIHDERVLAAIGRVPRHQLVPEAQREAAYQDRPLPIGEGQTISQPWVVARMTEAAGLSPGDTVLEVGTGSGYQAAVLGQLVKQVYTIEIVEPLGLRARADLARIGARNVEVRIGDGYAGWPEHAPFDAILVTAAPPELPPPLLEQLAVGGTLVAPVGEQDTVQQLVVVTRTKDGYDHQVIEDVVFVPMTGQAQH